MSDNKNRNILPLSQLHQYTGSFSDLADTSGSGTDIFTIHCLNGVDDHHFRFILQNRLLYHIQIRLTQHRQIILKHPETICTQPDLLQ